jgi:hypothetical protein
MLPPQPAREARPHLPAAQPPRVSVRRTVTPITDASVVAGDNSICCHFSFAAIIGETAASPIHSAKYLVFCREVTPSQEAD